jgi:hypothetical protein
VTPAEQMAITKIAAYEAARTSIKSADEVIDSALEIENRVVKPWTREERVATIAKFLIKVSQDSNPYAVHIVAARAVDRILELQAAQR